ncbi:MAG: GNAT family N-acetyltransferase [bacterium]|nr:GNAT family N-acetyltransferase [bacterium]
MDNQNNALEYIEQVGFLPNEIRPLWEKIKEHHANISPHFEAAYLAVRYEHRSSELLNKTASGFIQTVLVKDPAANCFIAYCIASIDHEQSGEIDSLFVEEAYRKRGIGESLVTRVLDWMDSKGVKSKKLTVAVGNEAALPFYRKFNFFPKHTVLVHRE